MNWKHQNYPLQYSPQSAPPTQSTICTSIHNQNAYPAYCPTWSGADRVSLCITGVHSSGHCVSTETHKTMSGINLDGHAIPLTLILYGIIPHP